MRINDVEKITGLTQKAIRLYEAKGLICVSRDENGYRNYSEEDVALLKKIRILRAAGISISNIKLYICGITSLDELIDERKTEILKENGRNSEKFHICESIPQKIINDDFESAIMFTEDAEVPGGYCDISVGIDIGTTTVSAVVYDIDNKRQLEAFSMPHNSCILSDIYSEQSVSAIIDKAEKLLYHILKCYTNIVSIGLTGQMHGIVYIDDNGAAVSDLINWQDKRGDSILDNGKTACENIADITKEKISTGYGITTHYYNLYNGIVPEQATGFCSIMDYLGMKICGLKKPIIHTTVAASFGIFDVKKCEFKKDKLSALGIEEGFLPCVTGEALVIGECNTIPVSVAIGDNQASILGTVRENSDSILVNIGTGSQISAVCDYKEVSGDLELRPFIEGKYLVCGAALCGGYAYSMLEQFFRSYASYIGISDDPQYNIINRIACEAYDDGIVGLEVDVSFFGKRSDPDKRGMIKGIDRQNFNPKSLVLGVLKGMCNELYDLYEEIGEKRSKVIASGGAVKKIGILKNLIAECFDMRVSVNSVEEEAATGAALFSAYAVKRIRYINGFSEHINDLYEENGI